MLLTQVVIQKLLIFNKNVGLWEIKRNNYFFCTKTITSMSDFAFMRFLSNNLLTQEESKHKDEIINLTEQVLDANGLECDERISKLSEEKLREILEEVRKLRNRKKRSVNNEDNSNNKEEEPLYVR